MKTYQFIILAGLFTSLAMSSAQSQNREQTHQIFRIEKGVKARSLDILLANLDNARTEISLLDAAGKPWMSQYVWGENAYHGLFDLNALPDGDYILQVANRNGHSLRALKLSGSDIDFFMPREDRPVEKVLASYASAREGRLIARFEASEKTIAVRLANLKRQPATIHIVSLGGIPVFSRTLKDEDGFSCGINLDGVAEGQYYLYVQTADASLFQFARLTETGLKLTGMLSREEGQVQLPPVAVASTSGF